MKGQTVTIPDSGDAWATKPGAFRASDDFDNWVRARYEKRTADTAAALKASGFASPMVGLTDMFASGTFTPCAPYGTCWEPKTEAAAVTAPPSGPPTPPQRSQPQPAVADATQAGGASPAKPFQPVEVSTFDFRAVDACPVPQWANSRAAVAIGQVQTEVARTPEELRELQMISFATGSLSSIPLCHYVRWVHQGTGYRAVVRRKRVHHPVHWVSVGKKTGFVVASPLDKKGQPPANLRHGIYVPSKNDGLQQIDRVKFDPKVEMKYLAQAPKEFRNVAPANTAKAERPEIQGRLLAETSAGPKIAPSDRTNAKITYDYGKQTFESRGIAMPGHTSKPVVVGSLNSRGDFSGLSSAARDGDRNSAAISRRESGTTERRSESSRSNASSGNESRGSSSGDFRSSSAGESHAESSNASSPASRPK